MKKVIQLGGSFEATVENELVTFNKPVTNLGMHYVKELAAVPEKPEGESEVRLMPNIDIQVALAEQKTQHNLELEFKNEEILCINMYLDDLGIPLKDDNGQLYSIVGRIKCLEKRSIKDMSDLESTLLREIKKEGFDSLKALLERGGLYTINDVILSAMANTSPPEAEPVASAEEVSAKDYLQNKYPALKAHWNQTDINDDWAALMMEEYATQEKAKLIEKIEELKVDADDAPPYSRGSNKAIQDIINLIQKS